MSSTSAMMEEVCKQVILSLDQYKLVVEKTTGVNSRLRAPNQYISEYKKNGDQETNASEDASLSNEASSQPGEATNSFYAYLEMYNQLKANPLPPVFLTGNQTASDTNAMPMCDEGKAPMPPANATYQYTAEYEKKYQELLELLVRTHNAELDYDSKLRQIAQMNVKLGKLLLNKDIGTPLLDADEETNLHQLKDELCKATELLASIDAGIEKSPSHDTKMEKLNKINEVLAKAFIDPN